MKPSILETFADKLSLTANEAILITGGNGNTNATNSPCGLNPDRCVINSPKCTINTQNCTTNICQNSECPPPVINTSTCYITNPSDRGCK